MSTKPNVIIYHRADFDGKFSLEVAKKFLGQDTEAIGWDYSDELPIGALGDWGAYQNVYILDLSIRQLMDLPNLVWIDHHKTAIEKWDTAERAGFRLDGVAACRLAYAYFKMGALGVKMPTVDEFKNRWLPYDEPRALTLAGEYDVWCRTDPDTDRLQLGLRTLGGAEQLRAISTILDSGRPASILLNGLLSSGEIIKQFTRVSNCGTVKALGFTLRWEGEVFYACNCQGNSLTFEGSKVGDHTAYLLFKWLGPKKVWSVSLYGIDGVTRRDLSEIAVKYGGGGHRHACGFTCKKLPFELQE